MSSRVIEIAKTPLRPFRHGAVAVMRRFFVDRLFRDQEAPVNLVISTGGSGTTFLMKHLAQFVEINDPYDEDRLKHLPRMPVGWLDGRRVLYIHASPDAVFSSIKRRGWLHMHGGELGCLLCQFSWGRLRQRFFERAVRSQIDVFHAYPSDAVMVLAYDDIWSRVEEIATFFGVDDPRFVEEFPARRPRKSKDTQAVSNAAL